MGSVKLARLGNLQGWNPGSFLNENHDYQVYSKFYGDNLLNFDSEIHCFADDFKWGKGLKFIRPCSDSKVFKAEVYDKYQWDETVERLLNNGHETTLTKKTPIQVCSVKKIYQEVRCWIVKGQVVTASQYVIGGRVVYSPCFDKDIIDFCHKMTEKFQLADAFVMDICRTESGLKIIECGCINAAGFYCADLQKLLVAFEDNFC